MPGDPMGWDLGTGSCGTSLAFVLGFRGFQVWSE